MGEPLTLLRHRSTTDAPDPGGLCPPKASKRAGLTVPLEEVVGLHQERRGDFIALDAALSALEAVDARKCRVIELHYFGGLSMEEIGEALNISSITVRRDLKAAEAWLHREMHRR